MSNTPHTDYARHLAQTNPLHAAQYAYTHREEIRREQPVAPPAPPAAPVDPRIAHRGLLERTAFQRLETEERMLAVAASKEKSAIGATGPLPYAGQVQAVREAQTKIDETYAAKRAELRERIGRELDAALMAANLDDYSMSKPHVPPPAEGK